MNRLAISGLWRSADADCLGHYFRCFKPGVSPFQFFPSPSVLVCLGCLSKYYRLSGLNNSIFFSQS